jgi:hypothetical protein
MDANSEEARLVRRISHLRMLSRHTDDVRIAVELDEFIAETEKQIVTLTPNPGRKTTLH